MEPISLKYPSAKDPPESFTYCQEDGTTVELPVYIHPQTGKDVVKCILCKSLVRGSYFDRHFNSNTCRKKAMQNERWDIQNQEKIKEMEVLSMICKED